MTESQLELGVDLQRDRKIVKEQMDSMKKYINECSKKQFLTESSKEDFDDFRQQLLVLCDKYTENQRVKLDERFKKI